MKNKIEIADKLSNTICKLKCIGFLIEAQNPDHSRPVDFDEIQYGMSLIIGEIVSELHSMKKELE